MVIAAGNTLLAPPRRTGNMDADLGQTIEWMVDLYQALAVQQNTIGTVEALNVAVLDLQRRLGAAEAKLQAIADLAYLVGPISATYDATQLAAAYNKINAIIEQAKG